MVWKVEASNPNAHARTVTFFSYIWFNYDILSLHCCKLRSVVVIMLSYQPFAPGFDLRLGSECVMQYVETGYEMHAVIFFFASKPCITFRVGAGMPALRDSNYVAAAFQLMKATYRRWQDHHLLVILKIKIRSSKKYDLEDQRSDHPNTVILKIKIVILIKIVVMVGGVS